MKWLDISHSAMTADGTCSPGTGTNADQLDVQIHLALTETRADFERARIAAMKWNLSDES